MQCRSGTASAGPHGIALMDGVTLATSGYTVEETAAALSEPGHEWLQPGWCRVHLSHLMAPPEVDYVIRAVLEVARDGWKLLPQYDMTPAGTFVHSSQRAGGRGASGASTAYVPGYVPGSSGALPRTSAAPAGGASTGDGIRAAVDSILRFAEDGASGVPPAVAGSVSVESSTSPGGGRSRKGSTPSPGGLEHPSGTLSPGRSSGTA